MRGIVLLHLRLPRRRTYLLSRLGEQRPCSQHNDLHNGSARQARRELFSSAGIDCARGTDGIGSCKSHIVSLPEGQVDIGDGESSFPVARRASYFDISKLIVIARACRCYRTAVSGESRESSPTLP